MENTQFNEMEQKRFNKNRFLKFKTNYFAIFARFNTFLQFSNFNQIIVHKKTKKASVCDKDYKYFCVSVVEIKF